MNLIHDIAPARNNWEKKYARFEYQRIGWCNLWSYAKPIEVKDAPSPSLIKARKHIRHLNNLATEMGWND